MGFLSVAWTLTANAADPNDAQPRINGGQDATSCQWPTTALVTSQGSLCSSVLIHPQLVVTAAHCIDPDEPPHDIKFGEVHNEPERKVEVDFCKRSPNYNGEVGGTDIAFCMLEEPVEFVPATPAVYGCERSILQHGWPVTIVGFGRPEEEEQAGRKRFAETSIQSVVTPESTTVVIGEQGIAACNGDSGGPAYVQYPTDGSWHPIAIVSGGFGPCGYGARTYVFIHPWIPWMEVATGLDLTPCHDRDGTWAPTERCGRFAIDPTQDQVSWGNWCASALSGPSDTCGEPFQGELYDPFPPATVDEDGCGCSLGDEGQGGGVLLLSLGLLVRRKRPRFG